MHELAIITELKPLKIYQSLRLNPIYDILIACSFYVMFIELLKRFFQYILYINI